jgi:hypothetical protein
MKLLVKVSSLVGEIGVENFVKIPSLYEWCILTPEFCLLTPIYKIEAILRRFCKF